MKSLAPMDVWPQSLTNGFLALRKSGTDWIRHTPVLSFFFCSHRAGLVVSKKKKTYPSTLQYRLVYQKRKFSSLSGSILTGTNRFLFFSATNGFLALSRTDEFSALSGTNRYSSPALLNFRIWLEGMNMCNRLCW